MRCSTLISIDSIFPFLLRRNVQTKKSIPAIFNRSRNKKFNQLQRTRTIHLANQSLGQIHVTRAKWFPSRKTRVKRGETGLLYIQGLVNRLSPDCHIGIDRDVSTAYCRSSSGDGVDSLSRTICTTVVVSDWCITILAHAWWVSYH